MLKEVLRSLQTATMLEISLVVFFLIFVGIVVWALTRKRKDVDHWSRLPVDDNEHQHPI